VYLPRRAEDEGEGLTGENLPLISFGISALKDEAKTGLLV
jgi:hypothetical protein